MSPAEKIYYFQYLLDKLLKWYPDEQNNDLSILKSLKLLFFVSAANNNPDSNILIDEVFDKYVAMPLGHVESDIYNTIKSTNGDLEYFYIDNQTTIRKSEITVKLNISYTNQIDQSISFLQKKHPDLINYPPSDLVELSHLWYSWRKNYNIALKNSRRSWDIPLKDIKEESKIYSLQIF